MYCNNRSACIFKGPEKYYGKNLKAISKKSGLPISKIILESNGNVRTWNICQVCISRFHMNMRMSFHNLEKQRRVNMFCYKM